MPSTGNIAGFTYAQFYKRYQGKMFGTIANPASPGTNVESHALLMRDPINAALPAATRAVATFLGGGGFLGRMTLGVEEIGEFSMQFANFDGSLMTLANKSNIDTTTVTNWTILGPNHTNPKLEDLGMVLHANFQSRESGTDGDSYWLNLFVPYCDMEINLTNLTREGGVNPSATSAIVRPSVGGKFPNGQAFSSAQGFKNNRTDYFYVITEKPLGLTTWIADGTEDTFTLGYLPTKSTVTSGKTDNWVTKAGVNTAPTSISTSTADVVIAAAGTTGDQWHVIYPTDFDAVA
jgi:hypothetical protein